MEIISSLAIAHKEYTWHKSECKLNQIVKGHKLKSEGYKHNSIWHVCKMYVVYEWRHLPPKNYYEVDAINKYQELRLDNVERMSLRTKTNYPPFINCK